MQKGQEVLQQEFQLAMSMGLSSNSH